MSREKSLKKESRSLEVFEVEQTLTRLLKEKYGITSSVHKFDNRFDVYVSNYTTPEPRPETVLTSLRNAMKRFDFCEGVDIIVTKTKYGYSITMGPDKEKLKLMEKKEDSFKCTLCEKVEFGKGKPSWPIEKDKSLRCCSACYKEFIVPAKNEKLRLKENVDNITEDEIETEASNIVLDHKFIWLFSVLDSEGEPIEDGINLLSDAIDVLINNNAHFLVAFPYVDPNPEDKDVELVFADNPGPVIIYNREEATAEKPEITEEDLEELDDLEEIEEELED